MDHRPIAEMEALLDRERAVLKTGRLEDLAALEPRKRDLTLALAKPPVDKVALARIQQKAMRNAMMLQAAGAGVRAAQRRLKALREASGPIQSYGAEGQPQAIGSTRPTLSRKA